jgi:hypothetical protein
LHHAFSRADISHLAQVIHPFALGALALLGFLGARKSYDWAAVVLLIAAALFIVSRRTPIYQRITSATPWVSFDAGGKIFVPAATNQLFTVYESSLPRISRLGNAYSLRLTRS